ncbi:hypothetical protein H9Q69_009414 [Fusarium xylarioides]|nr:hypothetical protein H9Q70_010207 [Fusarium xylarioides]KAG5776267.1 hypothetical protein H9Q73_010046 [Fusarium xylarioides]KAG5791542.1 hypothetical protein H9Q69_009414 [Fusarium xylarioides]
MAMIRKALPPWAPQTRQSEEGIEIDDLTISFMRTPRVPDNETLESFPPWLGNFPLFKTDDYADKLPASMAEKGGIFIPMHQCEAIRIGFNSKNLYAIKIFVDHVNVISGEPRIPNAETACRRRELLTQWKTEKSIQDFIVTPYQTSIDGMATESGNVRQIVPMPVGSDHSVEAQMAAQDTTTDLQFEITQLDIPGLSLSNYSLISHVRQEASRLCRIPMHELALRYDGVRLEDHRFPVDYGMDEGAIIEIIHLSETGQHEMAPAPGGAISENIVEIPGRYFRKSIAVAVNVQILNGAAFSAITGRDLPPTPVTAAVYESLGLPFYELYEEPSRVSSEPSSPKSIAEVDGTPEKALENLGNVGLLDPRGPKSELQFASELQAKIDMEEMLSGQKQKADTQRCEHRQE